MFRPRIKSGDGYSGGLDTPGIPLRGGRYRNPGSLGVSDIFTDDQMRPAICRRQSRSGSVSSLKYLLRQAVNSAVGSMAAKSRR